MFVYCTKKKFWIWKLECSICNFLNFTMSKTLHLGWCWLVHWILSNCIFVVLSSVWLTICPSKLQSSWIPTTNLIYGLSWKRSIKSIENLRIPLMGMSVIKILLKFFANKYRQIFTSAKSDGLELEKTLALTNFISLCTVEKTEFNRFTAAIKSPHSRYQFHHWGHNYQGAWRKSAMEF